MMYERMPERTWERRVSRGSIRQTQPAIVTVMDSLNQLAELNRATMETMMGGVARAMLDMTETMSPSRERRSERWRKHKYDCECEDCRDDCKRDQCYCRCCIGDVDLVVYTRIGEVRVVPIVIENSRRREKEITLELSQWTTRGGTPTPVTAQIESPTKFTLAPCEEQKVIIRVNVLGGTKDPDNPDVPGTSGAASRGRDLDECEVVYADLRVTGCEIRPIRIALAILPYDCSAYDIECGCGCC